MLRCRILGSFPVELPCGPHLLKLPEQFQSYAEKNMLVVIKIVVPFWVH